MKFRILIISLRTGRYVILPARRVDCRGGRVPRGRLHAPRAGHLVRGDLHSRVGIVPGVCPLEVALRGVPTRHRHHNPRGAAAGHRPDHGQLAGLPQFYTLILKMVIFRRGLLILKVNIFFDSIS